MINVAKEDTKKEVKNRNVEDDISPGKAAAVLNLHDKNKHAQMNQVKVPPEDIEHYRKKGYKEEEIIRAYNDYADHNRRKERMVMIY